MMLSHTSKTKYLEHTATSSEDDRKHSKDWSVVTNGYKWQEAQIKHI